ncbi:MAG: hypothetical protein ABL930_04475 [Pseudobdellovibrio sp.]
MDKKNDLNINNPYKSQESFEAIKSLKNLPLEPSPFLAKRVLRNLNAKAQTENPFNLFGRFFGQFKFWPSFTVALASIFFSIVVFKTGVLIKTNPIPVESYLLGQTYVIRMDIRPLPNSDIAYAEISLPDDSLEFASQKFSEIKLQKKLVVGWDSMLEKQYMPIVVQGKKAGSTKVIVNFYDSDHNLVTTKEISLYFKAGV